MSASPPPKCDLCERNPARKQMCGFCGHINILLCAECRRRTEYCENCNRMLA